MNSLSLCIIIFFFSLSQIWFCHEIFGKKKVYIINFIELVVLNSNFENKDWQSSRSKIKV